MIRYLDDMRVGHDGGGDYRYYLEGRDSVLGEGLKRGLNHV